MLGFERGQTETRVCSTESCYERIQYEENPKSEVAKACTANASSRDRPVSGQPGALQALPLSLSLYFF